jgi:O-antigen ligase
MTVSTRYQPSTEDASRPGSSQLDPPRAWSIQGWLDVTGLTVFAVAIEWTFRSAAVSGGSRRPEVALLLATGLAYLVGRTLATVSAFLVPLAVVVLAAILLVRSPGDVLSGSPLSGPFGYANATGAFFVQAAFAGAMLASTSRWRTLGVLGLVAGLGFVVVPFAIHSLAAATVVLGLPAVALAARGPTAVRVTIVVGAVLLVAVLGTTIALGLTYSGDGSGSVNRLVDSTLTERRVMLWHDAMVIIGDHPWTGVGPGRFQFVSPTALADPDAHNAHNEYLQQGAEEGVVGLVLLVLLFLWALGRLAVSHRPGMTTAFAAAAVAALGVHASVDYVLHFPAIPMVAAALAGTGVRTRWASGRRAEAEE